MDLDDTPETDTFVPKPVQKRSAEDDKKIKNKKQKKNEVEEADEEEEDGEAEEGKGNDDNSVLSNGKYASTRYGKGTRNKPQDLFITSEETLDAIKEEIIYKLNNQFKIYDPCCGTKAIGNWLRKNNFNNIYEKDLYYGEKDEDKEDYLKSNFTDYDILITNIPFCSKYAFFEKAFQSKKRFVILCTLDCIGYKGMSKLFKTYGIMILAITGNTNFFKEDGSVKSIGICCWFFGNWDGNTAGTIEFKYFNKSTVQKVNNDGEVTTEIVEETEEDIKNSDDELDKVFNFKLKLD